MNYKDLCNEITALGFETELESEERVLCAANRALNTIFTERPLYRTLELYARKIAPVESIKKLKHVGGERIDVNFKDAKAYSFRTWGSGRCVIIKTGYYEVIDFSEDGALHRGFLHGTGIMSFVGNYSYDVYDIEIFDEIFSENKEDIPYFSDFREYEMKKYRDDFLAFVSMPTDENGIKIEGALLQDGIMRIPSDYSGKINVIYKSAPRKLTGRLSEEIILPVGCEHLPALLASAYVWLDDDAEKAQYYMSLYREAMSAVKYYNREKIDNEYHDVNGWA